MSRLAPIIFIVAFTTITGMFVVALLVMNMSEPVHFYGAIIAGAVVSVIASLVISKQIRG